MISPSIFFIFSKFWFFRLLGGKRAKNSPKWEITITSVMHHVSGTGHHLIIIFGTRMQNDDVQVFFFIFSKLWFFGLLRGQKGKKWPKLKNNYIRHTPYLRNRTSSDHNFWHTYLKWWYLQIIWSVFQNSDFLGC